MARCLTHGCGWMWGFHPWELFCKANIRGDGDATLVDVAKRLRCRRCRKRNARLDYRRNVIEELTERMEAHRLALLRQEAEHRDRESFDTWWVA